MLFKDSFYYASSLASGINSDLQHNKEYVIQYLA